MWVVNILSRYAAKGEGGLAQYPRFVASLLARA